MPKIVKRTGLVISAAMAASTFAFGPGAVAQSTNEKMAPKAAMNKKMSSPQRMQMKNEMSKKAMTNKKMSSPQRMQMKKTMQPK